MVQSLRNLGATGSTLLVSREKDEALIRSARNLQRVYTLPVELLNAGALLQRENILMTVDAVRRAEELWANERDRAAKHAEEAV